MSKQKEPYGTMNYSQFELHYIQTHPSQEAVERGRRGPYYLKFLQSRKKNPEEAEKERSDGL